VFCSITYGRFFHKLIWSPCITCIPRRHFRYYSIILIFMSWSKSWPEVVPKTASSSLKQAIRGQSRFKDEKYCHRILTHSSMYVCIYEVNLLMYVIYLHFDVCNLGTYIHFDVCNLHIYILMYVIYIYTF
jgi:hypothetical protein